jgi:hypothetical protein
LTLVVYNGSKSHSEIVDHLDLACTKYAMAGV